MPSTSLPEIDAVLTHYGLQRPGYRLSAFGNAGGFSGARLWRVAAEREFCLRQWPAGYPDETRLRFIHAVLEFAGMQVPFVPRLQRTDTGETAVRQAGHWWELTTWLPGKADFSADPSPVRLAAAMQALARVHLALEHFPTRMTGAAVSPGIAERQQRLEELAGLLLSLREQLPLAAAELRLRGAPILDYFERMAPQVRRQLMDAAGIGVPLQPCLRDAWHDHVLFTGNDVTGIVDFDAVRVESVAGDLARLLGSLVGDDETARRAGIAAYESLRPLADTERALIDVFDRSSVLMSGMNWLVWILIDGRRFDEPARFFDRLDELLRRMREPGRFELG